jgi:hypothetical protein
VLKPSAAPALGINNAFIGSLCLWPGVLSFLRLLRGIEEPGQCFDSRSHGGGRNDGGRFGVKFTDSGQENYRVNRERKWMARTSTRLSLSMSQASRVLGSLARWFRFGLYQGNMGLDVIGMLHLMVGAHKKMR